MKRDISFIIHRMATFVLQECKFDVCTSQCNCCHRTYTWLVWKLCTFSRCITIWKKVKGEWLIHRDIPHAYYTEEKSEPGEYNSDNMWTCPPDKFPCLFSCFWWNKSCLWPSSWSLQRWKIECGRILHQRLCSGYPRTWTIKGTQRYALVINCLCCMGSLCPFSCGDGLQAHWRIWSLSSSCRWWDWSYKCYYVKGDYIDFNRNGEVANTGRCTKLIIV